MKKIISFSLWGNNPKYCVGAIRNAESYKEFYPDWDCVFYITKDVPVECKKELLNAGSHVFECTDEPNFSFNSARFLAMDINGVTHVISRDTDSRFCKREVDAVNDWLAQDTALHVMKDHPHHGNFPILAGMFGLKKSKFPYSMTTSLEFFRKQTEGELKDQYYFDQIFLQHFIWNEFRNDCTIHDEFFHLKPFPSARIDKRFIGESFEADESRNEEHLKFIK